MLSAISRYGARCVPELERIVEACARAGTLAEGPELRAFEDTFARRLGGGHAVSASYGRMAAYDIFRALELPPGSQVVFPALTFWVVPEIARAAGLEVVFADVNPETFNLDPEGLRRVLTPRTRAVVPTHIYGLPCDMDEIMEVARRHGLAVIEDCAHALGASHRGRPVGSFGDAAFFSFQVLKPLNTCGGGMAFTRREELAARLRAARDARPAPPRARVLRRLRLFRIERALMRPALFSVSLYPILLAASLLRARPDVYLWERVRPLRPLPLGYEERYGNVQAALGLAGLERLDEWTARTRRNAARLDAALGGLPGVVTPPAPADRVHVYYQYSVYVPDRGRAVARCLRAGLDVESHHMDVCPQLPLFGASRRFAPGARRTADSLQIPVHAALDDEQMAAVARRARASLVDPQREGGVAVPAL